LLESQCRDFLWTMKWLVNGMVWESLGFGRRDGFAGIVLNISFFDATEEGGTFSFSRKIYKLALALVSGTWSKVFQFAQFTMGCECQSKLQICSSERNVPLLPVGWRKYN